MKLSLWPSLSQPWQNVAALAKYGDTSGWDGIWVADHFMGDGASFGAESEPNFESIAAVGALLAMTEHLEVGPLVLGASYRHPALVANWAASTSLMFEGRLVLGLGAGWQANEHQQYGFELPSPAKRVRRFDEYVTVINSLLSVERASFDGEFYGLDNALCEPKPSSKVDILIGGKGDKMLDIVGRQADRWNMWAMPEVFAERNSALNVSIEAAGRKRSDVRRSTQALVRFTSDRGEAAEFLKQSAPRAAFAGEPKEFADLCARWADSGVDDVIIPDFGLEAGPAMFRALDEVRSLVP